MYKPRRTDKFEYAAEVIEFVEDRHCHSCVFAVEDGGPMCYEASVNILLEEPVDFMEEIAGLPTCNRYTVVVS